MTKHPEREKARQTAYRLLKIRLRSEQEIREKLNKKGISKKTIEETIAFLKKQRFIDDQQFTQCWIRSRLNKPFGINRIAFELKIKGVEKELLRNELADATKNYDELVVVRELAQRRFAQYKNVENRKAKQRVFQYLARKGFSIDSITKAVKKL